MLIKEKKQINTAKELEIAYFENLEYIDFDKLFKNPDYTIPDIKIKLKKFGPDFTDPKIIQAFKLILLDNPTFRKELLKTNSLNSVLTQEKVLFNKLLIKLRSQDFSDPSFKKIAKDFLSDFDLPRNKNEYVEIRFKTKNKTGSLAIEINANYLNLKDLKPSISFVIDKSSTKMTLTFLYPDLLKLGLGGFADQFLIVLFKSLLKSSHISRFEVENPVSQYWSKLPTDNTLGAFKNKLQNSKFSTDENTLSKTDIKLWLYIRGYLPKNALNEDELECVVDSKKPTKTDLDNWLNQQLL